MSGTKAQWREDGVDSAGPARSISLPTARARPLPGACASCMAGPKPAVAASRSRRSPRPPSSAREGATTTSCMRHRLAVASTAWWAPPSLAARGGVEALRPDGVVAGDDARRCLLAPRRQSTKRRGTCARVSAAPPCLRVRGAVGGAVRGGSSGELGRARLGRAARGEAAPGLGRRRVRWTGFPSRRGHPIGDDKLSAFVRRLGIAAVRPGFGSSLRNWASERTDDRGEVIEAALADVVRNPDRGGLRAVGLVRALRPADGWTGCGACTGGAGRVRLRWRPIEPTSRLSAQVVAAADPPVVPYDHSSGW